MQRRSFFKNAIGWSMGASPFMSLLASRDIRASGKGPVFRGLQAPVFVYNNWSAYDELSDHVDQTEELAMRELSEIIRLKNAGIRIDYYVMDAFWFDIDGGYRTWHRAHWPEGPDRWLQACRQNNILPGMWFSTNLVTMGGRQALNIIPEWESSAGTDKNILCLFQGGYLSHLAETLQLWYDKGVRLFKFDFAYFDAATTAAKNQFTPEEIKEKNKVAFMQMLQAFRRKNQQAVITGYNGFGGDMENTFTPLDKKIDPRWLDTFDTLYCGDPRFSDTPMLNCWRAQDNYSDHQVSAFQAYGMPINRIDNCAFMIGKTGTCYYRANHCWKGMLILELARGGWMNVYHGNLELLNNEDAGWFAKAQRLYSALQAENAVSCFGPIPGKGRPYGFRGNGKNGQVFTIVNPSQRQERVALPGGTGEGHLLYADGGFTPQLNGQGLLLGPEQLAVVGFGRYAAALYELGRDESLRIPGSSEEMEAVFKKNGKNVIEAVVHPVRDKHLRILFQQFDPSGLPRRSWGGSPPDGKKMNELLKIIATQDQKEIPMHIEYDKMIWSGLSWGAGEIDPQDLNLNRDLVIQCSSAEPDELELKATLHAVGY